MSDWYSDGVKLIKEEIATRTGLSFADVDNVYNVMVNIGLVDYDTVKDLIKEWND